MFILTYFFQPLHLQSSNPCCDLCSGFPSMVQNANTGQRRHRHEGHHQDQYTKDCPDRGVVWILGLASQFNAECPIASIFISKASVFLLHYTSCFSKQNAKQHSWFLFATWLRTVTATPAQRLRFATCWPGAKRGAKLLSIVNCFSVTEILW